VPIVLEKKATNTLENVRLGVEAYWDHFTGKGKYSVIVCALPPLLRRTLATFNKQFLGLEVFCSSYELPKGWLTSDRQVRVLGEFTRLREYANKGDIAPVEVPEDVRE